jgi:hypothetical protein
MVRNLVPDIKGVWEQDADENIWAEERWSGERLEKTA